MNYISKLYCIKLNNNVLLRKEAGKLIQYCLPIGINHANCYIIADEKTKEAVIIDPGEFNDELVGALTNGKIKSVKYILLTHGHYDHILGVYDLKKYTGALVGIHKNDVAYLTDELKSGAGHIVKGLQKSLSCDFFLEDGMKISAGEIVLDVLFTPGHTLGGVCFVCETEREIFTGDTLFYHTIGRTDLPGSSMADMVNSLNRLKDLNGDYRILPGHERSTTLEEERKRNRYLRNC